MRNAGFPVVAFPDAGLAKKQGGIGTHVVKNVKRVFRPNLQSVRIRLNGTVKRAVVCVALYPLRRDRKGLRLLSQL